MNDNALATYQGGAILPVVNVQMALQRYQDMKDFITGVLRKGVDYGTVPGTTKDTLLKPGAEKLCWFFGLKPAFEVITQAEDWTGKEHDGEPFFYYLVRCQLIRQGEIVATGDGSCNSWEKKYRYRDQQRKCPNCNQPTIFKSKNEPGYYCWAKRGGCGATFGPNDIRIEGQPTGQVKNPDICDQVNTLLKMAEKRALVAATLIGANASEWFTQDMEDFVEGTFTETTPTTPTPPTSPTNGKPAPAPVTEKPWTSTAISWELVQTITTTPKKGEQPIKYLDLPTDALATRLNSMTTYLKAHPELEPDVVTEYTLKIDAAKAILEYRQ